MSPRLLSAAIGLTAIISVLGALTMASSCNQKRSSNAEIQSHEAKGEADAHEAQAKVQDAKIQELSAVLLENQSRLDQLASERGALLRKLAAAKQNGGGEAKPDSGAVAPPAAVVSTDLEALVAKDAEVIQAQDDRIKGLEAVNGSLVAARDQWKAAFEAERRRSVGLEIALDAQKKVSKSDRLLGRIEGLAIGLGAGYIAGRVQ